MKALKLLSVVFVLIFLTNCEPPVHFPEEKAAEIALLGQKLELLKKQVVDIDTAAKAYVDSSSKAEKAFAATADEEDQSKAILNAHLIAVKAKRVIDVFDKNEFEAVKKEFNSSFAEASKADNEKVQKEAKNVETLILFIEQHLTKIKVASEAIMKADGDLQAKITGQLSEDEKVKLDAAGSSFTKAEAAKEAVVAFEKAEAAHKQIATIIDAAPAFKDLKDIKDNADALAKVYPEKMKEIEELVKVQKDLNGLKQEFTNLTISLFVGDQNFDIIQHLANIWRGVSDSEEYKKFSKVKQQELLAEYEAIKAIQDQKYPDLKAVYDETLAKPNDQIIGAIKKADTRFSDMLTNAQLKNDFANIKSLPADHDPLDVKAKLMNMYEQQVSEWNSELNNWVSKQDQTLVYDGEPVAHWFKHIKGTQNNVAKTDLTKIDNESALAIKAESLKGLLPEKKSQIETTLKHGFIYQHKELIKFAQEASTWATTHVTETTAKQKEALVAAGLAADASTGAVDAHFTQAKNAFDDLRKTVAPKIEKAVKLAFSAHVDFLKTGLAGVSKLQTNEDLPIVIENFVAKSKDPLFAKQVPATLLDPVTDAIKNIKTADITDAQSKELIVSAIEGAQRVSKTAIVDIDAKKNELKK